jgi:hypothetical protein
LFFHTRGCGRIARPAFPAPSEFLGGTFFANLARIARRDRGVVSEFVATSFRGDAKHRTRNLEIPGLVLTHHPGMTNLQPNYLWLFEN